MNFKVGDIIEIVREDRHPFRYRHKGTLGRVIDLRRYGKYAQSETHYLIKFTCYKIPHIYMISDIDSTCKLYKVKDDTRIHRTNRTSH